MANMMLNVVFSGIGAGFENMLVYVIVAVFLAGLMVGRTPEYLGKKVEAKEVKLAMIVMLIHPLLILLRRGTVRGRPSGARRWPTPDRTGSARSSTSSPRRRPTTARGSRGWATTSRPGTSPRASCCLLGRFPPLCCRWRSPGSCPEETVPETSGTLRTDNLTFAGMLMGTVLLVGALSFMPAVVLGPVADHLTRRAMPSRRRPASPT